MVSPLRVKVEASGKVEETEPTCAPSTVTVPAAPSVVKSSRLTSMEVSPPTFALCSGCAAVGTPRLGSGRGVGLYSGSMSILPPPSFSVELVASWTFELPTPTLAA